MSGLRRGFTLLEVLIAVAVLGLLIVLLDQGVAFALRATTAQQQAEDRHGDLEAVDRTIRQLIARADPGTGAGPPLFRGTDRSLSLVSELAAATGGSRERVDALLQVGDNQLRLRWTKRRHVTRFGPAPTLQELVLLSGVRAMDIAYFNGTGWAASWSGDHLPLLVRVTMRFSDERRRWPPIEVAPVREAQAR